MDPPDAPPKDEPARRADSIADELSESEIETNSLTGGELDELLAAARPSMPSLDGVTAELTKEETDKLLARSRAPLPAPRAATPSPGYADASPARPHPMDAPATVDDPPSSRSRLDPSISVREGFVDEPTLERHPEPPPASAADAAIAAQRPEAGPAEDASVVAPAPPSTSAAPPTLASPVPKILLAAAAFGALGYGFYRIAAPETEAPPAPTAVVAPARPEPPKPVATEATRRRADVEREAKDALTRLRDGLRACVKQAGTVLPGSSPAVPTSMRAASGLGFTPGVNELRTPVWSCAKFHVDGAMRFQIQWQLTKANSEGMGVAWVDDDGDGQADRAFAFRATLKQRGQMEAGDVEEISPTHAVMLVSY